MNKPIEHRRCAALTLIEVLITLTLGALLLLALTRAVYTAIPASKANQTQATMALQGRRTLMSMLNMTRLYGVTTDLTSDPYLLGDGTYNYGTSAITGQTTFRTPNITDTPVFRYRWDQTSKQLQLNTGGSNWAVLLRGVTAFSVTLCPGMSPNSKVNNQIQRVIITMSIAGETRTGNFSYATTAPTASQSVLTLTGSASPRLYDWHGPQLYSTIDQLLAAQQ